MEIKRFRRWERKITGAEPEEGHSQSEPIKKEFKTAHLKQKQRQLSFLKDIHGRKVPTEGDPDQVSRLFRQQKNSLRQKWKWSSALNSSYKVKLKKKENNTTRYVWPKWHSFRYKQTASFKDTQVIRYCFHSFLSKHCLWQWTLGSLSNGENEARTRSESTKDLHLGKEELTKQNKRDCVRQGREWRCKSNNMGVIQVWRPGGGRGRGLGQIQWPSNLQQLGVKKVLWRTVSQEGGHLSISPAHTLMMLPVTANVNYKSQTCTFWRGLILWTHLYLRVTSSHWLPPSASSHVSLLPSASCMCHCPTIRGF